MPMGKGTYGSTMGRPPKKTTKKKKNLESPKKSVENPYHCFIIAQ